MDWNNLSNYAIFGFTLSALLVAVFVISCIVSAVKAIRDRKLIKSRNKARRTAQANGDVWGSGRKQRPNILIIHDGEREARVKMGSMAPRATLSPGSAPSSSPRRPGSGISSPGEEEQVSRHTETTVLAEVAYHRSSLCSSSNISPGMGEAMDGGEGGDVLTMTNGHYYLSEPRSRRRDNVNDTPTRRYVNNRNNYDNNNIRDNTTYGAELGAGSVDFDGDAVAYRTKSSPRRSPDRGLSKKKSRSLDSPYSSNKARSRSRSPKNRRSHSSTATERSSSREGWSNSVCSAETSPVKTTTIHHFGRYHYTITASDGDLHRSARVSSRDSDNPGRQRSADSNSSSFHGFTKNPNAGRTTSSALSSSSSHAHTAAAVAGRHRIKEHPMCATFSPRRSSYAVAVGSTAWADTAPVRRHSDEPLQRSAADCNRSVDSGSSSSMSHLYQKHSKNPVRARYQQQQSNQKGAENHAYETAGDSGGDNTDM